MIFLDYYMSAEDNRENHLRQMAIFREFNEGDLL